jgi:hypothetical protein
MASAPAPEPNTERAGALTARLRARDLVVVAGILGLVAATATLADERRAEAGLTIANRALLLPRILPDARSARLREVLRVHPDDLVPGAAGWQRLGQKAARMTSELHGVLRDWQYEADRALSDGVPPVLAMAIGIAVGGWPPDHLPGLEADWLAGAAAWEEAALSTLVGWVCDAAPSATLLAEVTTVLRQRAGPLGTALDEALTWVATTCVLSVPGIFLGAWYLVTSQARRLRGWPAPATPVADLLQAFEGRINNHVMGTEDIRYQWDLDPEWDFRLSPPPGNWDDPPPSDASRVEAAAVVEAPQPEDTGGIRTPPGPPPGRDRSASPGTAASHAASSYPAQEQADAPPRPKPRPRPRGSVAQAERDDRIWARAPKARSIVGQAWAAARAAGQADALLAEFSLPPRRVPPEPERPAPRTRARALSAGPAPSSSSGTDPPWREMHLPPWKRLRQQADTAHVISIEDSDDDVLEELSSDPDMAPVSPGARARSVPPHLRPPGQPRRSRADRRRP